MPWHVPSTCQNVSPASATPEIPCKDLGHATVAIARSFCSIGAGLLARAPQNAASLSILALGTVIGHSSRVIQMATQVRPMENDMLVELTECFPVVSIIGPKHRFLLVKLEVN